MFKKNVGVFPLLFCLGFLLARPGVCLGNDKDALPLVSASAGVGRGIAAIGDKIKYSIVIALDKDTEVEFPGFSGSIAGLTIKDSGISKPWRLWGRRKIIRWYLLETYTAGNYTIPKAALRCKRKGPGDWKEVFANEVNLKVISLLEKGAGNSDIRDIRDPVDFPGKLNVVILSAVIVLLTGLAWIGGSLFINAKRRMKKQTGESAYERACRALSGLARKDYPKQGMLDRYYSELSFIIRLYLEERFKLRAPEMTTEEFMVKLRDSKSVSSEHKSLLRDFLSRCDLVKFAQYGPSVAEISSSFESAERLVEQTKEETVI